MSQDDERPDYRAERFTVPMSSEDYEAAVKKAGSPSRLRALVRAFLRLWSSDEIPEVVPDDLINFEMRRAQKVPRKKKRR